MSKILKIFFVFLMTLSLCACNEKVEIEVVDKDISTQEMKSIAELSTVKCFFHNVVKSEEAVDKAWYEFWKKEKIKVWFEYEGYYNVCLDSSKIEVEKNDNNITIFMPNAFVADAIVDTNYNFNYYFEENSYKADIYDQGKALSAAQQDVVQMANKNTILLNKAKLNVQKLLEQYVSSIGKLSGKNYTVEFKDAK